MLLSVHLGDCDIVVVHDAVRPLVDNRIISAVIDAAAKFGACTCALRATDTTIEEEKGFLAKTLKREKIWRVQTPQAFKAKLILQAHRSARKRNKNDASDDAQLVHELGRPVKIVEGSEYNLKITTVNDLNTVRYVLNKRF